MNIKRISWILGLIWTVTITASVIWNFLLIKRHLASMALMEAHGSSDKDLMLQKWISRQGGIYVPVSEAIQPNPYLANILDRDIVTPSGIRLTLMNAAYVMRSLYTLEGNEPQVLGHFTSLDPVNPVNAPDNWERNALRVLESGRQEISAISTIAGEPYMRLLRTMHTQTQCLKCHVEREYHPGDVRGAFGVAIPMEAYWSKQPSMLYPLLAGHGILWALGVVGLITATRKIDRQILIQNQSENALHASESLYHSIIQHMPQCIFRKDLSGRFTFVNQHFINDVTMPSEKILGKTDDDLFPPALARKYQNDDQRVIREKSILETIEEHPGGPDGVKIVQVVKTPLYNPEGNLSGLQGIYWDITETRKLEEQLRQALKMEAVGQLAGGVAHNINNLLTGILGHIELALHKSNHPTQDHLKCAKQAVARASELVQELLVFSRKSEINPCPIRLQDIIQEVVKLVRNSFDSRIEIKFQPVELLPMVQADASQIHSVLMNICINARDAIENILKREFFPERKKDPFRIEITAEVQTLTGDNIKFQTSSKTNRFVIIRISDNGCGIDDSVRPHIFEPFFTTKETVGTGLGLASAYGILKQHKGWLDFSSRWGSGTTFRIFLPAIAAEEVPSAPLLIPSEILNGHETILFVDDEPMIQKLGKEILEVYGYRVLLASNGQECLSILHDSQKEIDLIILDLSMPVFSGIEVLHQIQDTGLLKRIIVSSGYSDQQNLYAVAEFGVRATITKPYHARDLVRLVRTVLDSLHASEASSE